MAKVELTAQNRSAGVGSQQPADAFRKTVPPALAEGPFFDRPMGSANGIGQWDRPMGSAKKGRKKPAGERCSLSKRGAVHRWGAQTHGVARPLLVSPESFRGRDARARVSLNLRNEVLSLVGRDREGLPRRGPQVILWRDREGLATRSSTFAVSLGRKPGEYSPETSVRVFPCARFPVTHRITIRPSGYT